MECFIMNDSPKYFYESAPECRTACAASLLGISLAKYITQVQELQPIPMAFLFPKIFLIWKSVPSQLARENKKFLYNVVKEGARARPFALYLQRPVRL